MDYELQIKPFEKREGLKYKVMQITDIALHTNKMQETPSIGKKFKQSLDSDKPSRIYTQTDKESLSNRKIVILDILKKDPEFIKMIQEEERNGFKVLIEIPNEGMPIFAGKDTNEFINSTKGQRIIRWMAKEESVH